METVLLRVATPAASDSPPGLHLKGRLHRLPQQQTLKLRVAPATDHAPMTREIRAPIVSPNGVARMAAVATMPRLYVVQGGPTGVFGPCSMASWERLLNALHEGQLSTLALCA